MKKASSLIAFSAIIFTVAMVFTGNVLATDCSFINDGLVACYPFNGNADDESGNGNGGTVHGAILTEDRFGNLDGAYGFDGIDDYVQINDSASLQLDNYTICAWICPYQLTGNRGRVAEKTSSRSYWLYVNDGTVVTGFYSGGYKDLYSTSVLSLSTWQFVCGTYDARMLSIYINGMKDNYVSASGSINQNNDPLIIGWKYNGIGRDHFNGILDDIRFYNRALSAYEIQQLYNEGNSSLTIFPPSSELVTTSGFDLTLILKSPTLSMISMTATLDGNNVTVPLSSCVRQGTLLAGGETFRCPSLKAGTHLGAGSHTLSVTLNLNDGSSISDEVVWEVLENTE